MLAGGDESVLGGQTVNYFSIKPPGGVAIDLDHEGGQRLNPLRPDGLDSGNPR